MAVGDASKTTCAFISQSVFKLMHASVSASVSKVKFQKPDVKSQVSVRKVKSQKSKAKSQMSNVKINIDINIIVLGDLQVIVRVTNQINLFGAVVKKTNIIHLFVGTRHGLL